MQRLNAREVVMFVVLLVVVKILGRGGGGGGCCFVVVVGVGAVAGSGGVWWVEGRGEGGRGARKAGGGGIWRKVDVPLRYVCAGVGGSGLDWVV